MKKISLVLILYLMASMILSGCGNRESASQIAGQTTASPEHINIKTSAQTDTTANSEINSFAEIDISDISELTEVKLTGNGKEFICNDAKSLKTLENIFQTSKNIQETKCPFDECALYITKKDGTTGVVYPATDGCNVIKTSSGYYTYGDETAGYDNSCKFWSLFDISDPHTTFYQS